MRRTSSSISDTRLCRYSSMVRWNASRSFRLTGTVIGRCFSKQLARSGVRCAPTVHDPPDLLDAQQLAFLARAVAAKPAAQQDRECLARAHAISAVKSGGSGGFKSALAADATRKGNPHSILHSARPHAIELVVRMPRRHVRQSVDLPDQRRQHAALKVTNRRRFSSPT